MKLPRNYYAQGCIFARNSKDIKATLVQAFYRAPTECKAAHCEPCHVM